MSFFGELKRRNVIRVGIAYAAIAWLLAQIADLALGAFGAADWVLRAFLIMMLVGQDSQPHCVLLTRDEHPRLAADRVAKNGKSVLVLEQSDAAGGYARGLQRGDYYFDFRDLRVADVTPRGEKILK